MHCQLHSSDFGKKFTVCLVNHIRLKGNKSIEYTETSVQAKTIRAVTRVRTFAKNDY